MHIRRFEGTSMQEVLREVREELGPDALVVSTRNIQRNGGVFGRFGKSIVEVTAAVDPQPTIAAAPDVEVETHQPDRSWNELRMTRALMTPLEAEIQQLRASVERMTRQSEAPNTNAGVPNVLSQELRALRQLADEFRSESVAPTRYLAAGIDARHTPAPGAAEPSWREAMDELARRLDSALTPPRPGDDAAVLYVGPPGAGKTTTLAKVAGRTGSERDDLVVLSTDVHRIGGDAALRGFAKRQAFPFKGVSSPSKLAGWISKLGHRPLLVDTAGRSRCDESALPDLLELRDALGSRGRVCLVLPATHKPDDLRADLERYSALEPDALAFTKLDESRSLGNIANLLLDGSCPPLQWTTAGQGIPEDLNVADPHELAARILGAAA